MHPLVKAEQKLEASITRLRGAHDLAGMVTAAELAMEGLQLLLTEMKSISRLGGATTTVERVFYCPVLAADISRGTCVNNQVNGKEECRGCEIGAYHQQMLGPVALERALGVQV